MFRIHWTANQPWMEHKKGAFVVKDIRSGRAGAQQPAPPLHQPGDETNKANLKKASFASVSRFHSAHFGSATAAAERVHLHWRMRQCADSATGNSRCFKIKRTITTAVNLIFRFYCSPLAVFNISIRLSTAEEDKG